MIADEKRSWKDDSKPARILGHLRVWNTWDMFFFSVDDMLALLVSATFDIWYSTVVRSRKSRKKSAKKTSIFSRPVTRSQKKNDMSALPPSRSARVRSTPLRFKC
jgi:hypothetical protein